MKRRETRRQAHTVARAASDGGHVVLAEMVLRLVAELQPEKIYLFGSQARGEAHTDSDYDLLVVVRERIGVGRKMEQRANVALWGLEVPIDVVILTIEYFTRMLGAAASLPATIEREGRLLYAA